MKTIRTAVFGLLTSMACLPSLTNANVVLNIQESGADVVASFSGSLDLTNAVSTGSSTVSSTFLNPSGLGFGSRSGDQETWTLPVLLVGPFGTGSNTVGTSRTGDAFGFEPFDIQATTMQFAVPAGYVSGSSLSGSVTWANTTLASLGLVPGESIYYFGTYSPPDPPDIYNTVTINVVPEPSTYAMALAGLACGGYALRRRRPLTGERQPSTSRA